jgi:hypothetical protein
MEADYPSLHDEAKRRFAEHPHWRKAAHTPLENDLPIIAAELARDAIKSVQEDLRVAKLVAATAIGARRATPPPGGDGVRVDKAKMINAIAGSVAFGDDNLAIALCTYLTPFDETNDDDSEDGWTPWVSQQCDETLGRIASAALEAALGGKGREQ